MSSNFTPTHVRYVGDPGDLKGMVKGRLYKVVHDGYENRVKWNTLNEYYYADDPTYFRYIGPPATIGEPK